MRRWSTWTRPRPTDPTVTVRTTHPVSTRTDLRSRRAGADRAARATQRGSIAPLVAVFVAILAVALIGLSHLGAASVRRARADAIADVTALAAVHHGATGAASVAAAGGARLAD